MDTPLDIQSIPRNIQPNPRVSNPLNFRLLLLSVFLDRLAFYGLRSIVIYYAVFNLNIERDEVIYYYGYYFLVTSVASFIGGLISDFLTGPKVAMIIGVSLCLLGGTMTFIENSSTFFAGMMLLLIGTGFFRTGSFSFIGHISKNNYEQLEKRFILHYGMINLGALLSAIIIGMIGYTFGYFYSIVAVCVFFGISLTLVSFIRTPKENTLSIEKTNDEEVQSRNNVKFVVLGIIGIAFFWMMFEFYGDTQNNTSSTNGIAFFGIQIPPDLLYAIPPTLSLLLFFPYYFIAKRLTITFKIAMGCMLLAALWIFWVFVFSSNLVTLGLIAVLGIGFLEAIMDLFVTPTMMTFICRYSPKKIYGTLFGIYSILCFVATKLAIFIVELDISTSAKIVYAVFLIGVAIYFLLVPNEFKTIKRAPVKNLDDF